METRSPEGQDEVFEFYGWDADRYLLATGQPGPAWGRDNIRVARLPAPLPNGLKDRTGKPMMITAMEVHRRLVENFEAVYNAIFAAGLWPMLAPWAGSYVFRLIRGGTDLSCHGLGAAVDHNPAQNPLGAAPEHCLYGNNADGRAVVRIFKDHGFTWGGDFHNRKDCMHFQYARGY
jgi:hypothetical protein